MIYLDYAEHIRKLKIWIKKMEEGKLMLSTMKNIIRRFERFCFRVPPVHHTSPARWEPPVGGPPALLFRSVVSRKAQMPLSRILDIKNLNLKRRDALKKSVVSDMI